METSLRVSLLMLLPSINIFFNGNQSESIPVDAWSNESNSWCVTKCKMSQQSNKCPPRYWCGEDLCKVLKGSKDSWELSCWEGSLTMSQNWNSKRPYKGQCPTNLDFNVENIAVEAHSYHSSLWTFIMLTT